MLKKQVYFVNKTYLLKIKQFYSTQTHLKSQFSLWNLLLKI